MSSIIETGNEIGKGLAAINLMVFTCLAFSLSASGTFIAVKSKNEQKRDGVTMGGILCSVGVILLLISSIRYSMVDKIKGLGTATTAVAIMDTYKKLF